MTEEFVCPECEDVCEFDKEEDCFVCQSCNKGDVSGCRKRFKQAN